MPPRFSPIASWLRRIGRPHPPENRGAKPSRSSLSMRHSLACSCLALPGQRPSSAGSPRKRQTSARLGMLSMTQACCPCTCGRGTASPWAGDRRSRWGTGRHALHHAPRMAAFRLSRAPTSLAHGSNASPECNGLRHQGRRPASPDLDPRRSLADAFKRPGTGSDSPRGLPK